MIEILPPLEKYKYDTWRILSMKCYIAILCACGPAYETSTSISGAVAGDEASVSYLSIDYMR
jgi:hypothetical protein